MTDFSQEGPIGVLQTVRFPFEAQYRPQGQRSAFASAACPLTAPSRSWRDRLKSARTEPSSYTFNRQDRRPMNILAPMVALVAVTGLIVWMFFNAGQAVPRAGYVLGSVCFLFVLGVWGLIAVDDLDGPGASLGLAIASTVSLLCLGAEIGLVAGAMKSVAPVVGFGLGLASFCAIHLWIFRSTSPWVGASLLLVCCIGGMAVGAFQKRGAPGPWGTAAPTNS